MFSSKYRSQNKKNKNMCKMKIQQNFITIMKQNRTKM